MSSQLNFIGSLEPNKKTVLFIPGNMCSPRVFDKVSVPTDTQSAVIDWANSDGPWDIESIGRRVNQLIQHLQLNPVYLAGYSAGGAIAIYSASESENTISGLLLSNTGANTRGHGDPDFPKKIQSYWGEKELIDPFIERCFARPISQTCYAALYRYIHQLNIEPVYEAAVSLREVDLKPRLSEIACKVTIAHGLDDTSRTPTHAKELHEHIHHSKLKFLKGGHTIMVENQSEWEKELHLLLESN